MSEAGRARGADDDGTIEREEIENNVLQAKYHVMDHTSIWSHVTSTGKLLRVIVTHHVVWQQSPMVDYSTQVIATRYLTTNATSSR